MTVDTAAPARAPRELNDQQKRSGRVKFLLILLVCASPLLLSYLTYYVIKPAGRNNYGALIDPQAHPIPAASALDLHTLDGKPVAFESYLGKWVLLQSGASDCPADCQKLLFTMRQLRLMQGKERERIERVWLITDNAPVETLVMREYDGTDMLRVNAAALKAWLPVEGAHDAASGHLYLIDPRGHLMMRFPKDANPAKVKSDISKLLKSSAIG